MCSYHLQVAIIVLLSFLSVSYFSFSYQVGLAKPSSAALIAAIGHSRFILLFHCQFFLYCVIVSYFALNFVVPFFFFLSFSLLLLLLLFFCCF